MTNKYYKIKKSNLYTILTSTVVASGLVAAAFGMEELDRRNGGIQYSSTGIEVKTIFDENKDGIPDYTRVTIPIPPSRFPFNYLRKPTQEEITYFKAHYKKELGVK